MPTLRVLTYNVRSLRDDSAAVSRVIRAAAPHVVCVQEAPRLLRWRSKCAALARRAGLVVVTGGRTAAGNLILSALSVDVDASRDELLSREPGLHRRGVALARLKWQGRSFAVGGIHLDLQPQARLRHVVELEQLLARFVGPEVPMLIAGDVNDLPGSAVWSALSRERADVFAAVGAADGFTYSATAPARRIDGVFADPRMTPVSAEVLTGPDVAVASDHRPLLVEIELG